MDTLGIAIVLLFAIAILAFARWWRQRTRRHQAQQLVAALAALVPQVSTAFVAWHARDGVALWNAAAHQLFGATADEVMGKPVPAGLASLQQAAVGTEVKGRRLVLRHADGNVVQAMVSLWSSSGRDALFVATIDAVTPMAAPGPDVARAQRDALVREVHHRIKNSLQGVAGLLRQHLSDKPALKPLLEAASSQVATIAAVHGLHGETHGTQINLRMLVARVAASVSGIMHVPIVLSERCVLLEAFTVNEEESVPVAMVLNELIMNAVKHRRDGTGTVILDARERPREAQIRISNPGALPLEFDFANGVRLGNGLGLIRSLLPRRGAGIELRQQDDCVIAALTLRAPDVLGTRSTGMEAVA
ncbi:sensor histidine kinase [Lysobacter tyrosinilyticus]